MKEEKLRHILALQKVKGIGDIHAKKLIEVCGTVENVFKEKETSLKKINGIGTVTLKNLWDAKNFKTAEEELKLISQHKIQPLYFLEKEYPKNLKNCADSPILLFQDGNFDFQNTKIISIVGTRKMTNYGRNFCEKLIADLKEYNPMIVSGFAYGVDICAHKAALENELQTIGVFAHGFGELYPKAHKKYMAAMYEKGGFLTEFWYHETPLRENFLKRNRIVAGISEATIVIESAEKGGALVTADIANSYNRDVYALPGRFSDTYSKGCNALIQNHKAALVTSAKDVIDLLGWGLQQAQPTNKQTSLFVNLEGDEKVVYDYLVARDKELLDIIALECKIPVYKIATILFNLEMKGVVQPLPGKVFSVV